MPQGKGTYGSKVGRPKKRGSNPKNKNILDTPMRKIPGALMKKAKQKVKNVLNNTPKQNMKKVIFGDANPKVKARKKLTSAVKKVIKKKPAAVKNVSGGRVGLMKTKVSKKTGRVSVGKTPGRKIVKRKPSTMNSRNKAKRNNQKKFLKK